MRILVNLPVGFFTYPALEPVFARLRSLGEVRLTSHNTADEIRSDLSWAEAVIMWSWPVLTDDLLEAAPQLQFIGHLDVTQRGARVELAHHLPVSISRNGFSPAVAEMALGLILSTLRRISDYHNQMRLGQEAWVTNFPTEINPLERELTGQNVGIVGLGNVGRRLAQLLEPFHCTLRVVDPYISDEVLSSFGAERVDLTTMIRESDIVVLCAASNAGSRHLLGSAEIELFRPYSLLVNVARAVLVDTDALIKRLKRGDLFAAIDVFDHEPLEGGAVLRSLPNAYLTPHRAGGLTSSVVRILSWLVDDLEAQIAGRSRRYPLIEAMLPSLDS